MLDNWFYRTTSVVASFIFLFFGFTEFLILILLVLVFKSLKLFCNLDHKFLDLVYGSKVSYLLYCIIKCVTTVEISIKIFGNYNHTVNFSYHYLNY